MSAAATAAGYLYASGRLRGKNKEGEESNDKAQPRRKTIRVAALPEADEPVQEQRPAQPARTVRVEYRTRRWKPE
jgi:hypothetical protein